MYEQLNPDKIMQTGLAFWASKTLLSAIEIGLFTELSQGPEHFDTINGRLGLHPRSARDFLDALVALGFLQRAGDRYANTPETDFFLDRKKPSYLGGSLEMANAGSILFGLASRKRFGPENRRTNSEPEDPISSKHYTPILRASRSSLLQ